MGHMVVCELKHFVINKSTSNTSKNNQYIEHIHIN
eukprot:UN02326